MILLWTLKDPFAYTIVFRSNNVINELFFYHKEISRMTLLIIILTVYIFDDADI
jgi:hypothetical protein